MTEEMGIARPGDRGAVCFVLERIAMKRRVGLRRTPLGRCPRHRMSAAEEAL